MNYGWNLISGTEYDALDEYVEAMGAKAALESITKAMPTQELKETLEYIFRNEDFNSIYLENHRGDEDDEDC